jgi:hypothetical protein
MVFSFLSETWLVYRRLAVLAIRTIISIQVKQGVNPE